MGRLTDYELEQLAHQMKPYLAGWITGRAVRPVQLVVGEGGDHDHSQYLTETLADALYLSLSTYASHLGDVNAHHNRIHSMISASDHSITGDAGDLIGVPSSGTTPTLYTMNAGDGITITPSSTFIRYEANLDAAGGLEFNLGATKIKLDESVGTGTFGAGGLELTGNGLKLGLPSTLSANTSNIVAGTTHSHLITHTSDAGGGSGTELLSHTDGGLILEDLTAESWLDTPLITSPNALQLAAGTYIHTDDVLQSTLYDPGLNGMYLNFLTGEMDVRTLEADELIIDLFIARASLALVQGLRIGKSTTKLTRNFTIPTQGNSAILYLEDIPGLGDMPAFEVDDFAQLNFYTSGGTYRQPFERALYGADHVYYSVSGPTTYIDEDFESFAADDDPPDWYDTAAGNSMDEADQLADVQTRLSSKAFGFQTSASNSHTHWTGTGYQSIGNYRITGRFMISTATKGWGITFGSKYGPGGSDEYYRIRGYSTVAAQCVPHGPATVSGTAQGTFDPAANVWNNFKIEYENTGTQVNIRARFWEAGDSEPGTWEIDCYDSSSERYQTGTFGFWNWGEGDAFYDDIFVESMSGASGTNLSVDIDYGTVAPNTYAMNLLLRTSDVGTMTVPSGWNFEGSMQLSSPSTGLYGDYYSDVISGTVGVKTFGRSGADSDFHMVYAAVSGYDTGVTIQELIYDESEEFVTFPLNSTTHDAALIITVGDIAGTATFPGAQLLYQGSHDSAGAANVDVSYGVYWVADLSNAATNGTVTYSGASWVGALVVKFAESPEATLDARIGEAFGKITASGATVESNEQAWTWTTVNGSSGQNVNVPADSTILSLGKSGQGYVDLSTVGIGRPKVSINKWTGTDPVAGSHTTLAIMGNVKTYVGAGSDEYGFFAGDNDAYVVHSDARSEIRGIPLNYYGTGGKKKLSMSTTGTFQLGEDIITTNSDGFVFYSSTGDLRIGDPAGDNLYWDQSTGILTITGSTSLVPGTQVPWNDITGQPSTIYNSNVVWADIGGDTDDLSSTDKTALLNQNQAWADIQSLPPVLHNPAQNTSGADPTVGTEGLHLNAYYMGYWHPTKKWTTFFDRTGRMMLTADGSSPESNASKLIWDGSKLAGYDGSGVEQWAALSTTGRLRAGGGSVELYDDGIRINTPSSDTWTIDEHRRLSMYYSTRENAALGGRRLSNNGYQTFLQARGHSGSAWGTVLLSAYAADQPNFPDFGIGGHVVVSPGQTSVVGAGLVVGTNSLDFSVSQGRIRIYSSGGTNWAELYVSESTGDLRVAFSNSADKLLLAN